MSLLTDKNVKGVDTVGDIERFGALLAYGNAFKEVGKVFTNLEKVQNEH